MAKPKVEILVDASGSMGGTVTDTVGAVDKYIKDLAEDCPRAKVTVSFFDNTVVTAVKNQPAEEVGSIKDLYYIRGMTALNDAIGQSITRLKEQKGKKKVLVILTDGYENASTEYSSSQIKDMLGEAESDGWLISYLGADQDGFAAGQVLGLSGGKSMTFSKGAGTVAAMDVTTQMRSAYFAGANAQALVYSDEDRAKTV